MKNKQEKHHVYAALISEKVAEMFEENQEDIQTGDNLTHFIHALSNTVPNLFYNKITGEDKNNLEFNHIANHLVFQYSKKED